MILDEFLDTRPKTLFASRPLLNTEEIRRWAKDQGFHSTLSDGDMHVTIAFSKEPFEWQQQFIPARNRLTVRGGKRHVEQLGDQGAITLCFSSNKLKERWEEFKDGGASWDFPSYKAHITISYDGEGLNLDGMEPYTGDLIFGPEKFKEIDDDWVDHIEEDDL